MPENALISDHCLSTDRSSHEKFSSYLSQTSSQTESLIAVDGDFVFGMDMPRSRRMNAGNPAFARLRHFIRKVNLLGFF